MRNLFWGILFILLGLLFLMDNMGMVDFSELIRTYWPVIFILWGIDVLLRKKPNIAFIPEVNNPIFDNDLIHRSNIFGNISINISSLNFKGGSISNVFGDCNIDLSKSVIKNGEHLLRVNSVFGDVIVQLPKDCSVSVTASVLMGDLKVLGKSSDGFSKNIHITSPDYQTAEKKINLHITHLFGSIIITQQ
jgi:lia operon protein LiaF